MQSVDLTVLPCLGQGGEMQLPGSKSISNRALLLASLAQGTTTLTGLLDADDVQYMQKALLCLGVSLTQQGDHWVIVGGAGTFPERSATLFLGNAGTAFRPLTAALALLGGDYQLSGVARMHERPIGDLVDALRQVGATIHYEGTMAYPPLRIGVFGEPKVSMDQGILQLHIKGDLSSQFLSALLMALPLLGPAAKVHIMGELISKPYVGITLKMMADFGVIVRHAADYAWFELDANQTYQSPGLYHVEGDASSASYFLAMGALSQSPVTVRGVGHNSVQGDVAFAQALALMGVPIDSEANSITAAPNLPLKAIDLDCNHIPDAAMTLAVLALKADGVTYLRNIASWRVKETDRLHAMATELRKCGAVVEESPDAIAITPPIQLPATVRIATYDDHRMAMCFSLLALMGVTVCIEDPACVNKTFPTYFTVFNTLTTPMA
jgi:3-phosphoshikimate 1-carboxyvinyltransferase